MAAAPRANTTTIPGHFGAESSRAGCLLALYFLHMLSEETLMHVVLVEDDFFDRTLTMRGLRAYGMSNPMHACERAEEALVLLETNKAIGLILLDLTLPGMSGLEFLSKVRSNPETANLPVVVLTGSSSELDAERCRKLRADGYLVKPVVFARVVEIVKALGLRWALLPAKAKPDLPREYCG